MGRGDAEQGAEGGMPGAAAVEAEDEFVEVALDVFAAQAVIDAERPAFEIGEDALSSVPPRGRRSANAPATGSRSSPGRELHSGCGIPVGAIEGDQPPRGPGPPAATRRRVNNSDTSIRA